MEVHHKLGKLLDVNDVLGIICVSIYNLGAPCNLHIGRAGGVGFHCYWLQSHTCSGSSVVMACLSAARSQSAGVASPVSDSLIPK